MKKLTYLVALMFASMLLITSCSKDETTSNTDPITDPTIVNGCKLTVVKGGDNENINIIDSIFYSGNKISKVNHYEKSTQTLLLAGKRSYEYSGNEIKVYRIGNDETKTLQCTYSFVDSKISQIMEASSVFQNNYYYVGDKIKYMTHYNYNLRDSTTFTYDSKGDNIIELSWYQYNNSINHYVKVETEKYSYDDKINPYKNSIYYLSFDESWEYFNKNNIESMEYTNYEEQHIGASSGIYYTYNANNLPTQREDWNSYGKFYRMYYSYQCN